jgi:hypothetical protein
MTADHGKCHCGQVEWEVKLEDRAHILWYGSLSICFFVLRNNTNTWYSHCDTCKQLGGGTYSLNQIVPKDVRDFMQTIKS